MNRIIPDFSKDRAVNSLPLFAEVVFRRLWNKADDFGRYFADPLILKAELFPRKEIRTPDLSRAVLECERAALLVQYTIDGEQYLQINNFNQRVRAAKSKFPPPPDKCQTNVGQLSDNCRLEHEEEKEEEKGGKPPDFDFFSLLNDSFRNSEAFRNAWDSWLTYRRERKLAKWTPSTLTKQAKRFASWGADQTVANIETSIANGWQGIFASKQQQGASPPASRISVETFRRAYDWLHNLEGMDYIPERDKAILRANLDDLRGKYKDEYDDVCTRLKDPFDALTKHIKKTGGILYA